MVWDRMAVAGPRSPSLVRPAQAGERGDARPDAARGAGEACRRVAEQLVESVRLDRDRDSLSCSVAFLWRQHVEVRLRQVIMAADFVVNDRFGSTPPPRPLESLWPEARRVLTRLRPQDGPVLEALEPAIRQLTSAAPDPARPLAPPPPGEASDLAAFHDAMTRLAAFLDGAATRLEHLAQWKLDALTWID